MVFLEILRQVARKSAFVILMPCLGAALLLSSARVSADASATSSVVKLSADPWCPYNCAPNSAHPGYMIELARAIFAEHGYTVEYRTRPWSRALVETHNGLIDGAVGATYEDGLGLVFGEVALGIDHTVVAFPNNSTAVYSGPHSLDGLRIGIIDNYGYNNGGPIDQYLAARRRNDPDSVVVLATDHALQQLIGMLQLHHIDAIFASSNVLNYTLKLMKLQGQLRISDTAAYNVVNIAFTPDARGRKLALWMDQGVRELRRNGRLTKILAYYGLTDWQPLLPLTTPHPAEIRHHLGRSRDSEDLASTLAR